MRPILPILAILALASLSCSETLQRRYDKRHGTTTAGDRYGSDRYDNETTYSTGNQTYQRDYSKVTDSNIRNADNSDDYNRKFVAQYEDMDRLADQVLFELDILEKRWNLLLEEYRKAKSSSRNSISNELDRINDDQKVLNKAYIRIYRDGKTDWPLVRNEVENTLTSFRRLRER
jgi:hypothetical protein